MWGSGFTKCKPYLTNLVAFYDGVTTTVDKGKDTDVVCLDSSKAFDTIPQNISLHCRDMDLMHRLLSGWGIGWIVTSTGSMAQCLDGDQRQVESILESALFYVSIGGTDGGIEHILSKAPYNTKLQWQNWRMGCHPEGHRQAQELGQCSPQEAQKGQVQGTVPGSGQLCISTGSGMQGLRAML